MSSFDIEKIAWKYVQKVFPQATRREHLKIVLDWKNKIRISRKVVSDFRSRAFDPKNKVVLDYGSGNGGLSIAFAEAGAKVEGVDIDEDLIQISTRYTQTFSLSRSPHFQLYDGENLPFEDNCFDAVISVSVLEHVTNPQRYINEACRTLKPGGIFYLALPNRLWPRETHTLLWFITYLPIEFARKVVRLLGRNPLEDNNLHFYTIWDVKKFINNSRYQDYQLTIIEEKGNTKNPFKRTAKRFLSAVGFSHKTFLPHIMFVIQK